MPGKSISVSDLVRRLRKQQSEILKALPQELFAEYKRLGKLIEDIVAQESEQIPPQIGFKEILALPRIPLFRHKQKLIVFLRTSGPATRKEIAEATGIPMGSLSSLLKAKEFKKAKWGLWVLKRGAE
jgi:hypothetical protein